MKIKTILIAVMMLITGLTSNAQTISVDMDTARGIQSRCTVKDTAQLVTVALRITGAKTIFSYQFKVAFDTTDFSFIDAQQDFMVNGEKNILTGNGGSVIGIAQLQSNPPAADTVEFAYTIKGSDESKAVTGDGLIGVLYLKSKQKYGDSSTITVMQAMSVSFNGNSTAITTCKEGVYKVIPAVSNTPHSLTNVSILKTIIFEESAYTISFTVPEKLLTANSKNILRLFSLDGKLLTTRQITIKDNRCGVCHLKAGFKDTYQSGIYLCSLEIHGTRFTQTISIP